MQNMLRTVQPATKQGNAIFNNSRNSLAASDQSLLTFIPMHALSQLDMPEAYGTRQLCWYKTPLLEDLYLHYLKKNQHFKTHEKINHVV